jgi:hypothetical protein
LKIDDLQADGREPRLMMPPSKQGKKDIKKEPFPVAIPTDFAKRLKVLTRDRAPGAPLLTKPSGEEWKNSDHDRLFKRVVERCGLANFEDYPEDVTLYALRHSDIVRRIKANEPLRIIAATHDTSVQMIESNYSRYIADLYRRDQPGRAA